MFEGLFDGKTPVKAAASKKDGLFAGIFDQPAAVPAKPSIPTRTVPRAVAPADARVPTSYNPFLEAVRPTPASQKVDYGELARIKNVPKELGGGQYRVDQKGEPTLTPRAYGTLQPKVGTERDHIIPVALGGTSYDPNMQRLKGANWWDKTFQKNPFARKSRQQGKMVVELEAIQDYKDGKISLNEARARVLNWDKIPKSHVIETAKKLPEAIKELPGRAFEKFFEIGEKYDEKIAKPIQRAILPKSLEYKFGVTERPPQQVFQIGEGLEEGKEFEPTTKEALEFGAGPVDIKKYKFTKNEKTAAEQAVRNREGIIPDMPAEFVQDVRLAKDAFDRSSDKSAYVNVLGKNLVSKLISGGQGKDGASVVDKQLGDKWIDDTKASTEKLRETDPLTADIIESLAFSLSSQGTAMATAAGTQAITKNPVLASLVAGGVSGALAYRMSSYEIMQQYLEMKNAESLRTKARGLNKEEEDKLRKDFDKAATKYGLWEAVPEMLSGGLGYGFLSGKLTQMIGSKGSKILTTALGLYGEELATEAITEMGQRKTLAAEDFPNVEDVDWTSRDDWKQAIKDVAPTTFLLSTVLGAGANVVQRVQVAKQEITDKKLRDRVIQKIEEETAVEQPAELSALPPQRPEIAPVEAEIAEKVALPKAEVEVAEKAEIDVAIPEAKKEVVKVKLPKGVSETVKESETVYRGSREDGKATTTKEVKDFGKVIAFKQDQRDAIKFLKDQGDTEIDNIVKKAKGIYGRGVDTYIAQEFKKLGYDTVSYNNEHRRTGKEYRPTDDTGSWTEKEVTAKTYALGQRPEAPKALIKKVPRAQLPVKQVKVEKVAPKAKPPVKKVEKVAAPKVEKVEVKEPKGAERISRLERRMKGALDSSSQDVIDRLGLSTYRQMNKKDQIMKAAKYVDQNQKEAMDVMLGKVQAPKGILKNAIFLALQQKAVGAENRALALKLASLEATRIGQEISILTEADEFSPVSAVQKLIKIHEKAIAKTTGLKRTPSKQKLKNDVKKAQPSKTEWVSFLEEIKC